MDLIEYIAIGTLMLGVFGFMWKLTKDNEKKVSGRSFGEYKKEARDEFRSKEACGFICTPIEKKLEEISKDVKILLTKVV